MIAAQQTGTIGEPKIRRLRMAVWWTLPAIAMPLIVLVALRCKSVWHLEREVHDLQDQVGLLFTVGTGQLRSLRDLGEFRDAYIPADFLNHPAWDDAVFVSNLTDEDPTPLPVVMVPGRKLAGRGGYLLLRGGGYIWLGSTEFARVLNDPAALLLLLNDGSIDQSEGVADLRARLRCIPLRGSNADGADHREWNVRFGSHVYVWRSLNRTPSRTSKITMRALSRAEQLDPGFNSEDYVRDEGAFPRLQGLRSTVTVTNGAEVSSH